MPGCRVRLSHYACVLFLLALLADSVPAYAQQSQLAHFSPDAKALYAAASAVTPASGTDVLVLDDEESYVFDADGTALHTRYVLYKILTQKGVDSWDNIAIAWEPWRQEQPVIRARVVTPDGVEHPLDPKTITNSAAKDDEDKTYGDRRVLRAPFPAVAVGSVVEEEDTSRESPAIPGAGVVRLDYFGRPVPVQHSRLILDAPASLPLHYEVESFPDLKPQRTEADGRVHITFDYGHEDPLEQADADLPGDVSPFPEVVFSTGDSWRHLADEYGKAVDARIGSSDLKPLVSKLVSGKQTRDDKTRAILEYLDKEVRYTGVEFGDAAVMPRAPSEVLSRKYGDCKDKAVLLVAMLRAAGVPAYVSLLEVGQRQDVLPDLPGMGMFDHAIVYAPGSPDYWVDATDEYARLGDLPSADQGRYALIIRPGSDSLVHTVATTPEDNILVEDREFHLAENGPAQIVEISHPHGDLEGSYRYEYGDSQPSKEVKENLSNYVKDLYLSDALDKIDHSDPTDLSKAFELTLTCNRAKRGSTDLNSAAAAIRFEAIFSRLPSELQTRETPPDKPDAANGKPKKPRTNDYQLPEPFITEWRYAIVPPAGFQPRPLPKDAKLSLGPANLEETFSADKDGIVHAVIRFDTVKSRFSVSEAAEMRNKIADVKDGEPIIITFEPIGQAFFEQGKMREGFQAYRDLVAAHPNDAIYHLRMAEALLSGGLGNASRQEGQLAIKLDPKSAVAEKTLADILESDVVGRKVRPGSDYIGAAVAFRAAEKLDPDDATIPGNLAILLEYNSEGMRYGPGANLKDAIAEYQSLKPEKLAEIGLKNNLVFAMFYAGEFAEARKNAEALNPQPPALIVACEAALNGSQSALAEAHRREAADSDFKQTIATAGQMLMNLRRYDVAADLLEAGASGDNAARTVGLASILRKARRHEDLHYPDDPAGLVMRFFLVSSELGFSIAKVGPLLSRNALAVTAKTDPEDLQKQGRDLRRTLVKSGLGSDVGIDLLLAMLQPAVEGNDRTGYRVKLQIPNGADLTMFVIKENSHYKVLDTSEKPNSIGLEILDRIAANDLDGARVLLDWIREEQHLAGGDDPLSGLAFPRIWTKGKDADAFHMKLAAAAILVQTKETAEQGVSLMEAARASATTDEDRLNISLALLEGYGNLTLHEKRYALSAQLLGQHPESTQMYFDASYELRTLGRFDDADKLAEDHLKRFPDDAGAMRELVFSAAGRQDYSLARERGLKIIQEGKATAWDFNNRAWYSLYLGKPSDTDLDDAIKASEMSPNTAGILHTLGCVYAEIGKTKEAREVLLQAMDLLDLDQPDSNYWYAFGRIAEQYGENDVAISDYDRVEKPKQTVDIPGSAYDLAQRRLRLLRPGASAR